LRRAHRQHLLGGALISAATLWLARRESRALAGIDNEP
jgi:hypothetical protein